METVSMEDNAQNCSSKNKTKSWSQHGNLIYVTFAASVIVIVNGCNLGYTSPALVNLNTHPNPFHLTADEDSWIGSVLMVGCCFGFPISGIVADKMGRKCAIALGLVPYVLSWVLLLSSFNFVMLLVSRFLCGFFGSWQLVVVIVYLAEVPPVALRGSVQACIALAVNSGVLIIYVGGSLLTWNWLAIIPAVILSAAMLMVQCIPETPRWLLVHGYHGGAEEALMWLRGSSEKSDVQAELAEMMEALSQPMSKRTGIRDFTDVTIYKPLLICCTIWAFHVFTGIGYMQFYTVRILSSTTDFLNPYYQTVLVGCTGLLGNAASLLISNRIGRRICLMTSGAILMLCLTLLGLFYMYQHTVFEQLTWLPVACLMTFQLSFCVGWGSIPLALTGELLPMRVRGIASGLAMLVMGVTTFLVTKFGIILANSWLHQHGLFFLFAALVCCGLVFVGVFLPETNRKSLEDIEADFDTKIR